MLSIRRNISNLIIALLLAGGCEPALKQPPQPSPPPPVQSEPAPVPVITRTEAEIRRLLDEADVALEEGRLTEPFDDNAYYRYLRIFSLDPDNVLAEEGIGNIVERYLEWAIERAKHQRLRSAVDFLAKARSVDENHPSIPAVEKLIAGEKRRSERLTYRLSPDAVERKADRVVGELHEIGREVARENARVVIIGRTDAEGRWIYQQLNAASPTRVRARFEFGDFPAVRLIH